jgi:hypothetical protein
VCWPASWRILCRRGLLADALPPWSPGSLVDALPPLLLDTRSTGGCFATTAWSLAYETFALVFYCRHSYSSRVLRAVAPSYVPFVVLMFISGYLLLS